MRILDSMRGHFALLVDREITTVAGEASFTVRRVHSLKNPASDWLMDIEVTSSHKSYTLYVVDVLRVYTGILGKYWSRRGSRWVTTAQIQELLREGGVDPFRSSYVMALLATFDDIETRKGSRPAIRYVPFQKWAEGYPYRK